MIERLEIIEKQIMKKLVALALSILLAGCGGGSSSDNSNTPTSTVSSPKNNVGSYYTNKVSGSFYGVIDGDTLDIKLTDGSIKRIRLMGIDAPESSQDYGNASRDNLANCVFTKNTIDVTWDKVDQYGRTVGKVVANGIDCNLKQINDGYAWHYKAYANEQSQSDRLTYANAEIFARNAKKGLWMGSCIIAPWDWRNGVRTCGTATLPTTPTNPTSPTNPTPTNPIEPVKPSYCSSLTKQTCSEIKATTTPSNGCAVAQMQQSCFGGKNGNDNGFICDVEFPSCKDPLK